VRYRVAGSTRAKRTTATSHHIRPLATFRFFFVWDIFRQLLFHDKGTWSILYVHPSLKKTVSVLAVTSNMQAVPHFHKHPAGHKNGPRLLLYLGAQGVAHAQARTSRREGDCCVAVTAAAAVSADPLSISFSRIDDGLVDASTQAFRMMVSRRR
jgi:hypothetical protein